jgi:hypothetical protein
VLAGLVLALAHEIILLTAAWAVLGVGMAMGFTSRPLRL